MVNLSAALRRALQACSAEELGRIAEAWAIADVPEAGWLGMSEQMGGQMQDLVAARFAWESLLLDAREILHQMIRLGVADGVPREDLQKLVRLTDTSFTTALAQLEQRLMLIEMHPSSQARHRLVERGQQQVKTVLAIPRDFRELFTTIDYEIYGPRGDRSQMKLVEVLEVCGLEKLQEMARLYDMSSGYYYYSRESASLAKSLAGKLVQEDAIEMAWEKLDPGAQKLCRWLCRADGSAEAGQLRAALELSRPALGRHLRQLESYGLVFDTFSGQERKIFFGRGIFKVLRRLLGEADQAAAKVKEAPEFAVQQDAPPIVYEGHGGLLYDLAIIVGATYQMVIEPTKEGRVPKRLANKIFPLLHGSRPSYYEETDNYLDMVFSIAEHLNLIALEEKLGQKARYIPGPKLGEWTNLKPSEQIRRLLELWWSPLNSFWSDVAGANYRPQGYNYGFGFYMDMQAARKGLLEYLTRQCQPGQWYILEPFLQATKARNPMLLREKSRYAAYSGMRSRKDVLASWDQTDGEMIAGMFASTLHELGLVSLGFQPDTSLNGNTGPGGMPIISTNDDEEPGNPYAFRLTELAAEVLWPTQAAKLAEHTSEQSRNLIVQPNFELLLLHPDYPTLYQLLPFTKVDQIELVSRLTLTQESVRRGVEAGWSVERILQTLRERSQKDLPQNVLYTLHDWGRLYKDATVSQIILLEVSSEAVADEICASSKFRSLELRRLGPCAIAVGGQVSLQVLRSALEKEGVILHVQGDILSARDVASASSSTYYGYGRRR